MAGQFIRGQLSTPPLPQVDLTGRTILLTGANSGLGLEAAKLLMQLNCSTIVLACRSLAKGEKARETILQSASSSSRGHSQPTFIIWELDLDSFPSVVAFSERCKDLPRLDAAILNAGINLVEFTRAEGYETTITVNVISTFLLAVLLIPLLRDSAKNFNITPKLAIVGSAVHFFVSAKELTDPAEGQILKTLSDPKKADMKARYFLSKLIVMLLVKYLASMLTKAADKDPANKPLVVINNVAPGLCKTNLFQNFATPPTKALVRIIGRSSEHGARTLVHGATAGRETHGQYLSECRVKPYSAFVKSAEGDQTARRIWQELSALYEEVKPGCTQEL
ncbi:uncharacterized protein Z520_05778 [Fonsecaea multimorphosa CBS 102226]|uniref:Ketoreductase (KR) domain-containing protein n=1 Tax=Fonsecaea multimorphosa CBS 102226 TaxID=1442371 RepID=A0A0D2JY81_9EURO|nr:uncharacterized protein Z520_05778 [Fonsecaea multimorphosa CBS 102226]KIX98477.1 hypothetical protein Z520_05778 [Fonsecaea multimorphosa CBS 102226]OAL24674.1 hypothetical protein AYO22_05463 [Fonsecaea multimorphosa]